MSFLQKGILLSCIFVGIVGYSVFRFFSFQETSLIEKEDIFSSEKIEEVKSILQSKYFHFSQKTKKEVEDGMISALVDSLGDKHSSYFPPKEAKEFSEVLRGDFEGIGAVIDEHVKGIIIRRVFPSSPASKAGLQNGDILTHVGTESLIGLRVEEAVKKIRGPKGSKVLLRFLRGEKEEQKQVDVTRDTIMIPSTQEKMLSGSIGYIEVLFFGDHTRDEFQSSFTRLSGSGAKGIILDFRNNGGGYLDSAVDILSFLLPHGSRAVTTRENDEKNTQILFTTKNSHTDTQIPLVMIINGLSASATEITAGALQDSKRAIIVGEKSYGKGSVQEPFVLEDGSILKVTIGNWYTPNDKNIDKEGITPDISIPLLEKDFFDHFDRQLDGAEKIMKALLEMKDTEKVKEKFKMYNFLQ